MARPTSRPAPRARSRLRWASTAVLLAAIGTAFVATWPNMGALRTHASAALLHDADARRALTKALVTTRSPKPSRAGSGRPTGCCCATWAPR
jgi:hypothetical protein